MLSTSLVEAFLKLSQKISAIEDTNLQIINFLPLTLDTFSSLQLSYECINFLTFDANSAIQYGYLFDPKLYPNQVVNFQLLNTQILLDQSTDLGKEILWGKLIVSSEIADLISDQYAQKKLIRSVVIIPLIEANKLASCLVLASSRGADMISVDEQELAKLIAEIAKFNLKIYQSRQETIKVTQDVYAVNSKLHEIDRLKDDFVSIASHELRTPMTAIRSYAWMALHKPDMPLTEKLKRYLERTLVSTERLINLVNDMLNVSRIESGRIEIEPEPFNITNLVGEVLIEINEKAKEKNLQMVHFPPSLPQVFADSNKVHQILLNLLGNALKFTPINGAVTISYFTDGKMVEVSIQDSGVGIASDDLNRLFKKFSRLDNSYVAASSTGGTGLGLFICKSLLDLMHGSIKARSDGVGKGSVFTFSLPIATQDVVAEAEKYRYKPQGEARLLEPVAIQAFPNEPA